MNRSTMGFNLPHPCRYFLGAACFIASVVWCNGQYHSSWSSSPPLQCLVNGKLTPLNVISRYPNHCTSCPPGFIPCANRCYQRLRIKATYAEAQKYCKLLHPQAHLAVPRTRNENICAAGLAARQPVWLGISDIKQEGLFIGDDERGVVDISSTGHVWSDNQPDNAGDDEDCVEMWIKKGFAEWNDIRCDYKENMPMCQLKL